EFQKVEEEARTEAEEIGQAEPTPLRPTATPSRETTSAPLASSRRGPAPTPRGLPPMAPRAASSAVSAPDTAHDSALRSLDDRHSPCHVSPACHGHGG